MNHFISTLIISTVFISMIQSCTDGQDSQSSETKHYDKIDAVVYGVSICQFKQDGKRYCIAPNFATYKDSDNGEIVPFVTDKVSAFLFDGANNDAITLDQAVLSIGWGNDLIDYYKARPKARGSFNIELDPENYNRFIIGRYGHKATYDQSYKYAGSRLITTHDYRNCLVRSADDLNYIWVNRTSKCAYFYLYDRDEKMIPHETYRWDNDGSGYAGDSGWEVE